MACKFYKLSTQLAERRDLRPSDKIVLAILTDRIGKNGKCWPGVRCLAKDSGLNKDTVRDSLERLRVSGALTIEDRGRGRSRYYRIPDESVRESRTVRDKPKCPETPDTGVRGTRTEVSEGPGRIQTDQLNQTNKGKPNKSRAKASGECDNQAKALLILYSNIKPPAQDHSRSKGKRHIIKLLAHGVPYEDLERSVANYHRSVEATGSKIKYRLSVGNFFGEDTPYETYADENWEPPATDQGEAAIPSGHTTAAGSVLPESRNPTPEDLQIAYGV